jgi:hypothetical protein
MNTVTITEDDDPTLVKGDLDEAEMYCRLASDLVRQLHESPEEEYLAGAHALIERARVVLRHVMAQQNARNKAVPA